MIRENFCKKPARTIKKKPNHKLNGRIVKSKKSTNKQQSKKKKKKPKPKQHINGHTKQTNGNKNGNGIQYEDDGNVCGDNEMSEIKEKYNVTTGMTNAPKSFGKCLNSFIRIFGFDCN